MEKWIKRQTEAACGVNRGLSKESEKKVRHWLDQLTKVPSSKTWVDEMEYQEAFAEIYDFKTKGEE